jgi:ribosomal protein S18 acetylase RimI-like enzyme
MNKSTIEIDDDGIVLREACQDDADVLWQFLALAAYEPDAASARSIAVVAAHLTGWQRPGDFGVMVEKDGKACGAAWARQFAVHENPTFFPGNCFSEVSIAVVPEARGLGLGTAMLRRLEAIARDNGVQGLCLNVRDTNPAIKLYQRAGYVRVAGSEVGNRVGGNSFGMILRF